MHCKTFSSSLRALTRSGSDVRTLLAHANSKKELRRLRPISLVLVCLSVFLVWIYLRWGIGCEVGPVGAVSCRPELLELPEWSWGHPQLLKQCGDYILQVLVSDSTRKSRNDGEGITTFPKYFHHQPHRFTGPVSISSTIRKYLGPISFPKPRGFTSLFEGAPLVTPLVSPRVAKVPAPEKGLGQNMFVTLALGRSPTQLYFFANMGSLMSLILKAMDLVSIHFLAWFPGLWVLSAMVLGCFCLLAFCLFFWQVFYLIVALYSFM